MKITDKTNNSCESYNTQLNKLSDKKSNFYKLIYELKLEEHNIIMTYKKIIRSIRY